MSTDQTMTLEPDMTTHAERIEMWCDLLATAPYAVQDDVPLDDLRAWIDGIRESSRAMAAAMTTTDTTPTPGGDIHAEAIRDLLSEIRSWHIDPDDDGTADDQLDEAIAHLDALDAARRDAEARAKRLNDALLIVAAIADDRGKRLSPYSPDTLSEDAQSEMGLHPGDIDKGGAA